MSRHADVTAKLIAEGHAKGTAARLARRIVDEENARPKPPAPSRRRKAEHEAAREKRLGHD